MNRFVAFLLVACTLCLIFSGCSSKTTDVSEEPAHSATTEAQQEVGQLREESAPRRTIEWCCSWTSNTEKIEKLVELANKELPFDIELTWPSDYNQTLVARFAAKDYPEIYNTETYMWNKLYADQSMVLDGCSFWNDLDSGIFSGIEATDGSKIAVPGYTQAYGIIYNVEALKSVGYESVPTTLSEFRALCETLTAAGYDPIAPTQMEDWTTRQLWLFPWGYDKNLEDTYEKMTTGELLPADVDWINKEIDFLDLYKEYVGQKAFDDSSDTAIAKVVAGKAAMMVQGDWELSAASGIDDSVALGMAGIPISEDENDCKIYYSLGTCTHVCAQADDAELGKQFIEWWYTSDTALDWWVNIFAKAHCFTELDQTVNPGMAQALELVKAGHAGGWGSEVVPEEVVTEITPLCEMYILGEIDRTEYLSMLAEKIAG